MEPIELRTHTMLWHVERKMYHIHDVELPFPVAVKQIGILFGVGLPWIMLLKILSLPFASPWHLVWIAPPAAAAWWANKPVAEGKSLIELAVSRIGYWFEAKTYCRLVPDRGVPRRLAVRAAIWRSTRPTRPTRHRPDGRGAAADTGRPARVR